jgi:prepilin-type N-terminal cleavage/methylation domain-containing protein
VRRTHGFTLLELAVTIAIATTLAALAYSYSRASQRNASLGSVTFDLAGRLSGLKFSAVSEQEDYVLVVVDAAGAACTFTSPGNCGEFFVLKAPQSGFTLSGFDPDNPAANATVVDSGRLRGIRLHPSPPGSPPAPFSTITFFHSDLTATVGGRRRFAIRFARDGSVTGEKAGSASGPWSGYAFALTTDQYGDNLAADRKGIVVAFPAGIVRTFSVR